MDFWGVATGLPLPLDMSIGNGSSDGMSLSEAYVLLAGERVDGGRFCRRRAGVALWAGESEYCGGISIRPNLSTGVLTKSTVSLRWCNAKQRKDGLERHGPYGDRMQLPLEKWGGSQAD